jgi:hypothetical protein
MPELKVSVSENTHKTLVSIVESSGETMQSVMDQAIESYRRSIFLTQANAAFLALRQNETLWQDELAERGLWDQTIADGVKE